MTAHHPLRLVIRIFIYFFTYASFQKIQITLLQQHYQTDPRSKVRLLIL